MILWSWARSRTKSENITTRHLLNRICYLLACYWIVSQRLGSPDKKPGRVPTHWIFVAIVPTLWDPYGINFEVRGAPELATWIKRRVPKEAATLCNYNTCGVHLGVDFVHVPRTGNRNSNMNLEKVIELYLQTLRGPLKVNLEARGLPDLAIWTQAKFSMDRPDQKNVFFCIIFSMVDK